MGNPMHRFEMGTPAQRVFMPDLVIGWWRLRPLLTETAPVELPEGLGADDIDLVVDLLQGFSDHVDEELRSGSLRRFRLAEAADRVAIAWIVLATWAGRYERNRLTDLPMIFEWLEAHKAAIALREAGEIFDRARLS